MSATTKRIEFGSSNRAGNLVMNTTHQRLGLLLAVVAVAFAIFAAVVSPILAFNWRAQPFIGAMLTPALLVDGSFPAAGEPWAALAAGIRRQDHLIGINGERFAASPRDYAAALENYRATMTSLKVGDTITVEFLRPAAFASTTFGTETCQPVENGSALCTTQLTLTAFPQNDFIAFFVVPYLFGVVALGIALVVLVLRPRHPSTRTVSSISSLIALFLLCLFDLNTTYTLIWMWILAASILGGSLVSLALVFPTLATLIYRYPSVRYLPVLASAFLGFGLLWLHSNPLSATAASSYLSLTTMLPAFGVVFLAVALWFRRQRATSATVRDQVNTVLIGVVLSLIIVVAWGVNLIFQNLTGARLMPINTSAAAPFLLLPVLSMAYAVLQYRLSDSDRIFSQTLTYSVMLIGLIAGYFLLVFSVSVLTQNVVSANDPLLMAVVVFIIAVLFVPVRTGLQAKIDSIYFRKRHSYQDKIETFAQKLSSITDFAGILHEYRQQLDETLEPGQVFIFLPSRQTGDFVAFGTPRPATDVRFAADSALVKWFQSGGGMIYLAPGKPWTSELIAERARLMILQALVIIEIRGANQVNGFVVVSPPRSSSGRYDFEELRFIQSLTNQISVAVERAQVVESLQRRVQELDVLSQVSQAANFTIDFDDLLELISTQSTRLIDASHFYIVLFDGVRNELYFAFFLENGERYEDYEDRRWSQGRDLFSEVVRSGQSLRVSSFAQAMSERRAAAPVPIDSNLKGWIGVPLLAGTRTLGALAAGNTQTGRAYSDDQLKIFQDIAALAATSLDKSRLFAETNARARQLAALNDISRKLVAVEFDLEKLLQIITASATDILDAEAGSLLLTVDDGSGDLEFRVAVGTSGQELVGSRIPAKRGLVGEVASTGQLVIVNDVMSDARWGGEISKSNFHTNNILAVPLVTQNKVIGVLEVLNKKNNVSFTGVDAELLTTFAGQAAVAIENARLFQLTDQQLSARLTELETLERIDVELNRSLDLTKVAEITVRYAIANSNAVAGVLGIVNGDPPHLEIVYKQGYEEEDMPQGAEGNRWLLDRGIVKRVMRTRQADLVPDVRIDPDYIPSLRGSLSQLTIPMMSGGSINALLILETNKEPRLRLADMPFLQRLAEHASIAIANAQLYAELTRANQSKSEFVGFVAHELKNPLTSMRGFADLLISGAVGDLNDNQRNFLNTIRSSAERMNNLVSDLNDVTKLQTNNMRIEVTRVDFRSVITETLRPLEKQIADKGQTLQQDIPDSMPHVLADQSRLIQVLTNLVSNAHKYTPENGRIILRCAVDSSRRDNKGRLTAPVLHISVSDTGIGMSQEDLAKLFTPYFRSDNPLTQQQPGTGLGLTITRGIIERHNGEIWVESELGVGTTFHFTLPLAPSAEKVAGD